MTGRKKTTWMTQMDEPNAVSNPPKNSPATDVALREIQSLINEQRDQVRLSKAGRGDMRWLIVVCVALSVPMVGVYFVLDDRYAEFISIYIQIIGAVLSGWGVFRSMLWKRNGTQLQHVRGIAWMYIVCFVALMAFYGILLASGVSLKYARGVPRVIQGPVQKK